jgi:hypothetical protein
MILLTCNIIPLLPECYKSIIITVQNPWIFKISVQISTWRKSSILYCKSIPLGSYWLVHGGAGFATVLRQNLYHGEARAVFLVIWYKFYVNVTCCNRSNGYTENSNASVGNSINSIVHDLKCYLSDTWTNNENNTLCSSNITLISLVIPVCFVWDCYYNQILNSIGLIGSHYNTQVVGVLHSTVGVASTSRSIRTNNQQSTKTDRSFKSLFVS